MYEILIIVYVVVSVLVVGLILVQQGKGAGMGASFSGASATLFGSSGAGNFLTRMTAILISIFFVLALFLGRMSSHSETSEDKWRNIVPNEVAIKKELVHNVDNDVKSDVPETDEQQTVNDLDVPLD